MFNDVPFGLGFEKLLCYESEALGLDLVRGRNGFGLLGRLRIIEMSYCLFFICDDIVLVM